MLYSEEYGRTILHSLSKARHFNRWMADVLRPWVGQQNAYDSVICLNVIEHVEDDRLAVSNLFTALRSGGRLCLLTPRSQNLFGSLDVALEHKRRYSVEQLRDLVVGAGFRVVHSFTFNRGMVCRSW